MVAGQISKLWANQYLRILQSWGTENIALAAEDAVETFKRRNK